jgi:hypothetical protein
MVLSPPSTMKGQTACITCAMEKAVQIYTINRNTLN